ncbi:MAG: glycosyltransferase family 4 protein [Chloroflexi bacterium]|nr:glycosyltransferase family 4 protein [Chloroflexota bacterium]
MRILIIQESDWFKRGPHNQHHLAEKLSLRGHKVCVIDHEILWRIEDNRGLYSRRHVFNNVSRIYTGAVITVIRPGIVKVPVLDYVSLIFSHRKEIRRQIEDFAPDVIVGFGILNSYLAAREANTRNIPFVYYWIDLLHTLIPFKLFQPLGKGIERRTLRQADMIIATNTSLRNYLLRMGACPEQTHILGFGIDPGKFDPAIDDSEVRAQHGIKKGDIVLFFVGGLDQFTGVREVALELARINDPRLKFLIVGDGSSECELRQIQEEYGLRDRLILTGRRPYDEIPGLVAAADVCLLPFHNVEMMREIVPLKLFDYMAMRKPIVSTRLPGVVEEFGEDNGFVYVDRPEDVVKKAAGLVAEGKLDELGAKARRFVESRSWDSITDKFEKFLNRAIAEKSDR